VSLWFAAVLWFAKDDRYLLSTKFMQVTFWLRFNNLNKQLGFFK